MNHYLYFGGFLIGFIWTFRSLLGSDLEKAFKQNKVWEIRSIYTLISLLLGHVIGSLIERIYLMFSGLF
ncbi:MAG: hypothetical protein WCS12_00205 [Acholeplasmataceae bacterium]|jgi:uncharacterized membrane protein YwzB|nr:hypothetical protein [Acholeplasmataceae bacterium]MCK9233561.1 hypothetical protein [Acholeplasmataceae bacterium]MCK9288795.1 hypothetical protein [Acholeplasmataceae bacterium]MCK9427299.1 hypothetical protein [Acholeplasmataceae bacterium]MDD4090318.1 hypothetical protein [Acholeplasmataceae bacterium]